MATARHPIRRAFGFLAGFLVLFFLAAFAVSLLRDSPVGRFALVPGRSVAVLPLEGEILRSDDFVETLKELAGRGSVAAVVVRIDSPGGAVAPSQEMYAAVRQLAARKPVVASLGTVAASGGYYVASAADVIVASPGTLTGSIGVVLSIADVSGLLDKLGVEADVLKAGEHKDMGSPFRPLSPEDRALFQQMLDQVHGQFVDAVAAGRRMDPAAARKLADGRIYTGQQARDLGLVDELGGLEDAVKIAAGRAGIEGEPTVERVSPRRRPWWLRALLADEVSVPQDGRGLFALLDRLAGAAGRTATDGRATLLWRLPVATEGLR